MVIMVAGIKLGKSKKDIFFISPNMTVNQFFSSQIVMSNIISVNKLINSKCKNKTTKVFVGISPGQFSKSRRPNSP